MSDASGAVLPGAEVTVRGRDARRRAHRHDRRAGASIALAALPAGTYTVTVAFTGLATSAATLEVTLNRAVTYDVILQVGGVQETIAVSTPAIDVSTSATGETITGREIGELPVNGRNYLDLLQLVPGVAINRQVDPNTDRSNPVLGERSGNNNFLIDGQSNKDTVNGGPAQQFTQETIAEFQVLTSGYKAEFGQASGAIVNVITRSGSNLFGGVGSFFVRDDALDASNSLDQTRTEPLALSSYNSTVALGGPLRRDKVFFFGSAAYISQERQLDFKYPDTGNAVVNGLLREQEAPYDVPTEQSETRAFFKLDERLGQHQLSQQINFTDNAVTSFLPLSSSNSLPSARNDTDTTRLFAGFGDSALLGNPANPYVVTLRAAFRSDDSETRPSQTDLTGSTLFNPYDSRCTLATCSIFGNLPTSTFGNIRTASHLDQRYTEFNANANRLFGRHDLKFGMNFLRTGADGVDARLLQTQLFATHDRLRAVRRRHRRPVPARRRRRSHAPRRRDSPREQLHGALRAGRLEGWRQADGQSWTALGLRLGIRSQGEFRAARRRLLVGEPEDRRARATSAFTTISSGSGWRATFPPMAAPISATSSTWCSRDCSTARRRSCRASRY